MRAFEIKYIFKISQPSPFLHLPKVRNSKEWTGRKAELIIGWIQDISVLRLCSCIKTGSLCGRCALFSRRKMDYVAQPSWQENTRPPHVSRGILITTHVKSNPCLSWQSPKHGAFSEPRPIFRRFGAPGAALSALCVCYASTYKYSHF